MVRSISRGQAPLRFSWSLTPTNSARQLQRYDIVISSYNTVASEWVDPKPKRKGKDQVDGGDDAVDASVGDLLGSPGPLFEVEKYYRSQCW